MTLQKQDLPAAAGEDDFVTTHPESTKHAHIERERPAYIAGDRLRRERSVRRIWATVDQNPKRFPSPGHHSPSVPLHFNTLLEDEHCELKKIDTPGRHIYYFDTLAMELAENHAQVRLERKQKVKGVTLKQAFDFVTVKIGDKAQSRVEDSVPVDLGLWAREGFWKALKEGIKAEVQRVLETDGPKAAEKRHKQLKALKRSMIEAVGHEKLKAMTVYPLVHLKRNTIETEFSPPQDKKSIVEIKTDQCDSETTLGDVCDFGQFEAECVAGDTRFIDTVMQDFIVDDKLGLVPTFDSKADPSFRDLRPWIMPRSASVAEGKRVEANRKILAGNMDLIHFQVLQPAALGLLPPPANDSGP